MISIAGWVFGGLLVGAIAGAQAAPWLKKWFPRGPFAPPKGGGG